MHPFIFPLITMESYQPRHKRSKQPMSLLTFFLKLNRISKAPNQFYFENFDINNEKSRFQIIKSKKESIDMQIEALKASQNSSSHA